MKLPEGCRWATEDDYDENMEPIRQEGVFFMEDYVDEDGYA